MDSRGSTLKGFLEFNKKVQFILLISNFDSSTLYGDFTKNITTNAITLEHVSHSFAQKYDIPNAQTCKNTLERTSKDKNDKICKVFGTHGFVTMITA